MKRLMIMLAACAMACGAGAMIVVPNGCSVYEVRSMNGTGKFFARTSRDKVYTFMPQYWSDSKYRLYEVFICKESTDGVITNAVRINGEWCAKYGGEYSDDKVLDATMMTADGVEEMRKVCESLAPKFPKRGTVIVVK